MNVIKNNNHEEFLHIIKKYNLEDLIEFSSDVKVLYANNRLDDSYDIFKIFFKDIDIASNGKEALELFYNKKYDLVITALDMPVMSGLDMIAKIRQISRHISILIIASEQKYFFDLIRLGIDGYVLKPMEVQQFVDTMQKVIENMYNKQGLYEYRINLEQMVEEKTKELQELNSGLEEKVKEELQKNKEKEKLIYHQSKMAEMGEMISNIAHQWRQPLSIISFAATGTLVEKEIGVLTDEVLIENLNKINSTAQHLSKTIEDFRSFLTKGDGEKREFNLSEALHSSLNIQEGIISQNGIRIIENLDDTIVLNNLPNGLTQSLINIINNAKDALVNEAGKKSRFLFVETQKENGKAVISLKDSGGGIPDDIIGKIFEPYFTTKHQSQGTGLGLHMTYKIITENMSGTVRVENENYTYGEKKLRGAKFIITLPLP